MGSMIWHICEVCVTRFVGGCRAKYCKKCAPIQAKRIKDNRSHIRRVQSDMEQYREHGKHLEEVERAARAAGMSYGYYVALRRLNKI